MNMNTENPEQYPVPNPDSVIEMLSRQVGQQTVAIAQLDSMVVETRTALDKARDRIAELEGLLADQD